MKWTETHGRKPRTGDKLLHVRFRSGAVAAHTYTANQIRWDDTGHPFDVVAVAIAKEQA